MWRSVDSPRRLSLEEKHRDSRGRVLAANVLGFAGGGFGLEFPGIRCRGNSNKLANVNSGVA